jgi:hypothetical protein
MITRSGSRKENSSTDRVEISVERQNSVSIESSSVPVSSSQMESRSLSQNVCSTLIPETQSAILQSASQQLLNSIQVCFLVL